jgi:hypothetical protein
VPCLGPGARLQTTNEVALTVNHKWIPPPKKPNKRKSGYISLNDSNGYGNKKLFVRVQSFCELMERRRDHNPRNAR